MLTRVELSVIVPCRFEPLIGEVTRAALQVAREEGADGVEVIVVGSGDWSLLPEDEAVRIVEPGRPLWSGPNRNRGLRFAQGELVAFLDSDCIVQPGWFAAVRDSQARGGAVCCGGMVSPRDSFWQATYNLTCFREYLVGLPAASRKHLPSFCLWGPRQAFAEVKGFDESWSGAEDIDLTVRLGQAGWPLRFEPSARVLHRPAARSFWRIVKHGWAHGGTSMRARRLYPDAFGAPSLARSPLALVLGGPLMATWLLWRTWKEHPRMRWVFPRAAPTVFFFRVAWCLGAAWSQLRPGRVFEPVANRAR